MKQLMLGLVAVCFLVAFQNCSNGASFQSTGDLVVKAGDESDLGTGGPSDINPGDGQPDPAASPTPPPTATPPTTSPTPPPTATPPVYVPPGKQPPGTVPPGHDEDDDCDRDDKDERDHSRGNKNALQYVCVLAGPGKSLKVGITDNSFLGQNGTPSDVCMTENACLNILSKKFDVKSAEKRGFCPNKNPHVVPMTDAEIEASLAKTELVKMSEGGR